ncbi:MAG: hypothetical protein N2745_05815, partial [Syntrophorhabdaceae bacterium]|nr:hypothetical protein [Syntrophorhabdaceae bacterium]
APGAGSYWRDAVPAAKDANNNLLNAAAPALYGGMLQLTYFITDTVRANLQYGVIRNNYSQWARTTASVATLDPNGLDYKGRDRINQYRVYAASIFYDPNPAFRLGFMWSRHFTNFNGKSNLINGANVCELGAGPLESYGTVDAYRVQVAYFF